MKMRNERGFTLIELLISVTTFAMLIAIITINLRTAQQTATIETAVDTLLADLNQQQLKAMVGDTEGRAESSPYGIHIEGDSYTLFHDTYSVSEPSNFSVSLPDVFQITTTFPGAQVLFEQGSGELSCFVAATCTENTSMITITDTTTNQQKILHLNRVGVVTEIE